jgi:thiol-disulfide isomerase/thioredoxin
MLRKIFISLTPLVFHILLGGFMIDIREATFILGIACYFFGFLVKSKKELLFAIVAYFSIAFFLFLIEGGELIYFFFIMKVFFLIAIISGYYSKKTKFKALIFPIAFSVFMLYGFKDYHSLLMGRNYIVKKKLPNITLFNEASQKVNFNIKNKLLVLDFWSSACGSCIEAFPDFERTALKYKDDPNIVFYSINIPVRKETMEENISIVKSQYNYKFNKLYSKDFSTCDSLGFRKFPTLVIAKNGVIYYQGSTILDEDITIHHIETEIKRISKIN